MSDALCDRVNIVKRGRYRKERARNGQEALEMKRYYEKVCREAGCSEQEIKKIRAVFANERRRRKLQQKNREKYKYRAISLERLQDLVIDEERDTEKEALRRIALAYLKDFLGRFTPEEQWILLMQGEMSDQAIAKTLGLSTSTMRYRRKRLMEKLKTFYLEETFFGEEEAAKGKAQPP